jgi:hypothetical protein
MPHGRGVRLRRSRQPVLLRKRGDAVGADPVVANSYERGWRTGPGHAQSGYQGNGRRQTDDRSRKDRAPHRYRQINRKGLRIEDRGSREDRELLRFGFFDPRSPSSIFDPLPKPPAAAVGAARGAAARWRWQDPPGFPPVGARRSAGLIPGTVLGFARGVGWIRE